MSLQAAWEVLFWFREVHPSLGLGLHLADVRATLADDDAGGNIGDEELDDDFGWVYHDFCGLYVCVVNKVEEGGILFEGVGLLGL